MGRPHTVGEHAHGSPSTVKDPVCSMDVEPGQAAGGFHSVLVLGWCGTWIFIVRSTTAGA